MKKSIILTSVLTVVTLLFAFTPVPISKFMSAKTHINFYSHTPVEDIQANNYASVSTLNRTTGDIIFSVPMQGFEFEKALMQKHFNSKDFLDTKVFPKAKLKGKIANLSEMNFSKEGVYQAVVEGELTIKGATKAVKEKAIITVKENSVELQSKFNITLADFGIAFTKGKPSTNISKTIDVTVHAVYQPE